MSRKISFYGDDDEVIALIREVSKRHRDLQWAEFSLILAIEELYKSNKHNRILRYMGLYVMKAITLPFGTTRWYHRRVTMLMKKGLKLEEAAHKMAYEEGYNAQRNSARAGKKIRT